jgi:hypothetical protein
MGTFEGIHQPNRSSEYDITVVVEGGTLVTVSFDEIDSIYCIPQEVVGVS